jgi:hypothetical protein
VYDHPAHRAVADACLLLRSHFEELWLRSQVLPVVRQLEDPESIPEDQLGAALAYLELLWIDAARRSGETEAAFRELLFDAPTADPGVRAQARRMHASVRIVREVLAGRVARITAPPAEEEDECEPAAARPDRIRCGADGTSLRPAGALDALRRSPSGRRGRPPRGAGRR